MLDFNETKQNMQKAIEHFKEELKTIRSNRASAALLDGVSVEVYGQKMGIVQLATIATPEPRLITISPWDKSQVAQISKAITDTLDLLPSDDGSTIRVSLPALTEETRNSLIKKVKEMAENAKISLRNTRRETLETLEKQKKNSEITEDDFFKGRESLDKLIGEMEKEIGAIVEKKEEELREV